MTHRVEERVGHAPADRERVQFGHEILQKIEFRRHLGSADNPHDGPLRRPQREVQGDKLTLHRTAGVGGQKAGDSFGGRVGPMGCGKCVVDVEVAHLSERCGEFRIIRLFAGVEAHILEQHDLPRLEGGDLRLRRRAYAVVCKRDRGAEEVA